MDVMIIATKACTHRKNLEKELEHLQIPYARVSWKTAPTLSKSSASSIR